MCVISYSFAILGLPPSQQLFSLFQAAARLVFISPVLSVAQPTTSRWWRDHTFPSITAIGTIMVDSGVLVSSYCCSVGVATAGMIEMISTTSQSRALATLITTSKLTGSSFRIFAMVLRLIPAFSAKSVFVIFRSMSFFQSGLYDSSLIAYPLSMTSLLYQADVCSVNPFVHFLAHFRRENGRISFSAVYPHTMFQSFHS